MSVRLSKEESEKLLDERKERVKKVCLTKNDLSGLTSRVALVLDTSGSMSNAFRSGMVQAVIERLLPLAMAFDDNGEMEFWTFSQDFRRHPAITRGNFYTYLNDNGISAGGGTNYAPVMLDVFKYFIMEEPEKLPNYVLYLTDGDNFDPRESDKAIKELSKYPIFFQFVGLGAKGNFKYLEKLDDMEGRYVDNANFFALKSLDDVNAVSDSELYTMLLDEYPKWLQYPEVKELISKGDTLGDSRGSKKLKKMMAKSRGEESVGIKVLKVMIDILVEIFT